MRNAKTQSNPCDSRDGTKRETEKCKCVPCVTRGDSGKRVRRFYYMYSSANTNTNPFKNVVRKILHRTWLFL